MPVWVKGEGLDRKAGSDGERRRKDAVKLVIFLISLERKSGCAEIFVRFPLGNVGCGFVGATINRRMTLDVLEVVGNVVTWVGAEGTALSVGVQDRVCLERKVDKAFCNEGRTSLNLWIAEVKLVREVRAELFGVSEDKLDGALQLGLDVGDGPMLVL